jgi:hypothetical protein
MSTRSKRAARIAATAGLGEFISQLRAHEDACDRNWMTRHDSHEDRALWLITPISHGTREEDALDDSNYAVAERLLNEASSFGERCQWPDWTAADGTVYPGTAYYTGGTATRDDAWPGGVIETILVRADDAPALRELMGIVSALSDYPVLDDEHHSELEHERSHPSDRECYADEQCECEVRNHEHAGDGFGPDDADEDGEVYCDCCREYVRPGTRVIYGELHEDA